MIFFVRIGLKVAYDCKYQNDLKITRWVFICIVTSDEERRYKLEDGRLEGYLQVQYNLTNSSPTGPKGWRSKKQTH